jgi:hypothetical protein
MTFAKTFVDVFLALILAAVLIFFLYLGASFNKERAETRAFLSKSAIDHETVDWTCNHRDEDPDGQILQKRIDAINKAQRRGDEYPPRFSDCYTTLKQAIILPGESVTVPVGTGVEFVGFQQGGTVWVRYSGVDMTLPASALVVR